MIKLLSRRHDGTFVAEINGLPYHVLQTDEDYWQFAVEEAHLMGGALKLQPEPEPLPISDVVILPAVTLWERLTEDEADKVNDAMATQPVRTQRIFTTANTFRSDHELWPLLERLAIHLFGQKRSDELLAHPDKVPRSD